MRPPYTLEWQTLRPFNNNNNTECVRFTVCSHSNIHFHFRLAIITRCLLNYRKSYGVSRAMMTAYALYMHNFAFIFISWSRFFFWLLLLCSPHGHTYAQAHTAGYVLCELCVWETISFCILMMFYNIFFPFRLVFIIMDDHHHHIFSRFICTRG